MKIKIGKREKKAIILGSIALFLVISYLLYDWFAVYKKDLISKRDAKRLQLSHMIGKISEKEETEKRIIEARTELEEAEKGLIPGDKPAVGTAELQKVLKNMATSTGIEVKSEKVINPVDIGNYAAISVEITFVSTAARLRNLLYSIETSSFLLNVTDMKVRVTNLKDPTDVQVNLTVKGFIRRSDEGEKSESTRSGKEGNI